MTGGTALLTPLNWQGKGWELEVTPASIDDERVLDAHLEAQQRGVLGEQRPPVQQHIVIRQHLLHEPPRALRSQTSTNQASKLSNA